MLKNIQIDLSHKDPQLLLQDEDKNTILWQDLSRSDQIKVINVLSKIMENIAGRINPVDACTMAKGLDTQEKM